jgi:pilus assembly protein Flp/PilA
MDYTAQNESGIPSGIALDIIVGGGLRPSGSQNARHHHHFRRRNEMLDYLRIMLNARLAKMDERGASAVEYGLLIAGIAALIVVVVFAFGGVIKNIFQTTCNSVGASSGNATC